MHAEARAADARDADVFEAQRAALAQGIRPFRLQPGQRGLLVLINGQVVGT
jgi:hypothetical protein